MAKYHMKENGEPGKCEAAPGRCPKKNDDGSPQEHYDTPQEASRAFEDRMNDKVVPLHRGPSIDELAKENFDKNAREIYGNEIPDDHLEKIRERYVEDIKRNPGAKKEIRDAHRKAQISPQNTTSSHLKDQSNQYDSNAISDDKVRAEIRELNQITGQKTPYDTDFDPELDNAQKTATRVEGVAEDLSKTAHDPYLRDEADKATLLQASDIIKDSLKWCDFSDKEKTSDSLEYLVNIQETFNIKGHNADSKGQSHVAVAYWRVSESLSDALYKNEFRN